AALASLGQPDELARRVEANAAGRHHVAGAIEEPGLAHVPSRTNLTFCKLPGDDSDAPGAAVTRQALLIRPMAGGWMRVTIGTDDENRRFVEALDAVLGD